MKDALRHHLAKRMEERLDTLRRSEESRKFEVDSREGQGRAGDLLLLSVSQAFPVEWLLLGPDPEHAGHVLAVAADTHPMSGSGDFSLPGESAMAPLTLRLAESVSIPETLDTASFRRRGRLEPELLARVLEAREGILRGQTVASERQLETDVDPEYEDWIREVVQPARETVQRRESPRGTVGESPRGQPRKTVPASWFRGLAAVFALVSLGLSSWIAVLEQRLAQPVFDPPLEEIHLNAPTRTEKSIRVPSSTRYLMLFLILEGRESCMDYRLEVLDSAGDVVSRKTDLSVNQRAEVRLWVPREHWREGRLSLRLAARCDGREITLDEKSISIEREP